MVLAAKSPREMTSEDLEQFLVLCEIEQILRSSEGSIAVDSEEDGRLKKSPKREQAIQDN